MIKNIVLLANILIIAFFKSFFNFEPVITYNLPDKLAAGEEFVVDVSLQKEQITGFAKLQFEFPEGITATVIEGKGASYTFKDQKAKFIWMSLPTESSFNISFRIKVDENLSGLKSVFGEFSFLENNEKKTVVLAEKKITIGEGAVAEASETKTEVTPVNTDTPKTETSEVTTSTDESDKKSQSTPSTEGLNNDSNATKRIVNSVEPSVTREIDYSNISAKELTVKIIVTKGNIQGFAKLQETLPSGFTASKLEAGNATFSFEDQKIKFLWMNLPEAPEFILTYKLKIEENISGTFYVNGEFSYMEDGETKKHVIAQQAINLEPESALAKNETAKNEKPAGDNNNENSKKVDPSTQKEDAKKDQKTKLEKAKPVIPVSSSPEPITGISYKVQVAASHIVVETDYFLKKNNLSETVAMEMHEGWNKYTIGNFPVYKEARDHREIVKEANNIVGPFVTAYNNGGRITVQEALMLTKQKWFK